MIGYIRVSSREQEDSQLGLEAQRATILRAFPSLERFEMDVASGRGTAKRDGLERAIVACEAREATGIVVAKYDRLSRSIVDFGRLVERAQKKHWTLTVLDIGVDMETPMGRLLANVLVSVAQYEAEMTGVRTKEAMAAAKARGQTFGRPPVDPAAVARARELLAFMKPAAAYRVLLREGQPIGRSSVYSIAQRLAKSQPSG